MFRTAGSLSFFLVVFYIGTVVYGSETRPQTHDNAKSNLRRKTIGKMTPNTSEQGARSRRKPDTLIASMGKYPGEYEEGINDVNGIVSVRFNNDDSFLFHLDVLGLDADSMGGVHIHEGKTCKDESMVKGHYWRQGKENVPDSWTPERGAVWTSDENGRSISSFRLSNGYGPKKNSGHAVVIHQSDGTRIACGVLIPNNFVLMAVMGKYPSYDGNDNVSPDIRVKGDVKLYFDADGQFEVRYDLSGLPKDCSGCGVHVHTGTTCDDHSDIGDHYYTTSAGDLWTADGGAVYNSDNKGKASGSFFLFDGYSFVEHVNHAVVVHAQGGERIGCGILLI